MRRRSKRISSPEDAVDLAMDDAPALSPQFPIGPVYRAEIVWKDGVPTLASVPALISQNPAEALHQYMLALLDVPYKGPDPALQGLSQGEAILAQQARQAANGDPVARREIMDRIMGAPVQRSQNVNLSGDINTFLDKVAEQTRPVTIIEAVATPAPHNEVEDL